MAARLILFCLLLFPTVAHAADPPIFALDDPRGDDHGDGTLVYPLRDDLDMGDLDLIGLLARGEGEGTLFEATFANPIASPAGRLIDPGGSQMESSARLGFHTLNLDVYIDTDRVPGSGEVAMLPGRRAVVDSTCAWEKVIVLTPRPAEARKEMNKRIAVQAMTELAAHKPRVERADEDSVDRAVEIAIDRRYFFPTRVRVSGRRIQFFVPGPFLGGPARDTWAYVVAVSGSSPFGRHDVAALLGLGGRRDVGLMIVPVAPAPSRDSFGGGREGDDLLPQLVDIVAPAGRAQEEILKDYDLRSGRPASVPGVVPATRSSKSR